MNILKIDGISKSFADHKALDNVSLEVPEGSIYGLLGPNGAGKTTLIRVINRITIPDSGKVYLSGKEITTEDIMHIGYMPEERGLYVKMRVGEQVVFFARLHGLNKTEATKRAKEWFARFGIEDWWNKKIEDLSKGMAQKIQFICTVIHEPKVLIFDEPFSGFDPINAEILKQEILRLRNNGSTIILSTHNMSSVEELCDYITLINKSQNILSGSVKEIRIKAGGNTFTVTYGGDKEDFESAIEGKAEIIGEPENILGGYTSCKIHIAQDEAIRSVIASINEKCNLRSFQEIIPSMNDIFIRAVNGTL